MLDTHYARDQDARETYDVNGESFHVGRYVERGRRDAFSGMRPTSKWLRLEDIETVLRGTGFDTVEIVESREERNGARVLLFAERSPGPADASVRLS
jgi:tRNA (mo5U34)-methyltransferase